MFIQSIAHRAEQLQQLLASMQYSTIVVEQLEPQYETGQLGCELAVKILATAKKNNANVYLIGNGGSAAIVSHAKTDLMNVGKLKAITLLDSAIMTCFSNDYGYENVFSRQLDILANAEDVLIAVSSSGMSKNILNAVDMMRQKNAKVITLSGFKNNNDLRVSGDLNFWIDSENYTLVEIAHLFILHHLADCLKE